PQKRRRLRYRNGLAQADRSSYKIASLLSLCYTWPRIVRRELFFICRIPIPIDECGSMTITVQEITDREQWNGFLTSQPRGHLLQSFEWGELNCYLGGHIYRLGALDNGRMVGAMLVLVAQVPLPLKVPGIHFNWLYCCRGPAVEQLDAPALSALIEY